MEEELQKIYDSEINVEITWLWDGGIDVKIGNAFTGYAEEGNVATVAEVIPWLQKQIAKHYPDSTYNRSRQSN